MAGKSDIVKGALDFTAKLLSGEGDDAAKAGIKAYHGTWNDNLTGFDNSLLGQNFNNRASKAGHWFSTNPDDAAFFGDNVYEVELSGNYKTLPSMEEMGKNVREKLNNIVHNSKVNDDTSSAAAKYVDYLDATHAPSHYTNVTAAELSKARQAGFDGAKLKGGETVQNVSETGDHYVVFNPELIRIIRKLGIAGASAMLGYNLMEQLDPKQALAATMADEEYRVGKAGGGSVREGYAGKGRVIGDVVDQALKFVMGGGEEAAKTGIKAYHVSPHDFDRFDLSRIGTGEGNQAYGHGLYFAENPKVSGRGGEYWRQFHNKMKSGPEQSAASVLSANKFDRDKSAAQLESMIKYHFDQAIPGRYGNGADVELGHKMLVDDYQKALDMIRSGQIVGPRTYEVDIKANPGSMLDWDKTVADQAPEVLKGLGFQTSNEMAALQAEKAALQKKLEEGGWNLPPDTSGFHNFWDSINYDVDRLGPDYNRLRKIDADIARATGNVPDVSGGQIYRNLSGGSPSNMSNILRDRGVPGIKYLDGMSRKSGEGTSNYVIFDDKLIDIKDKYAEGGEVDDDIYHAVRLARDVGGATNENPQVMMTDANGVQYDATGKVIPAATPQANSNSAAAPSPTTPEEVGRRAAEDPAIFDAMMERYAVTDRDIVDYEALKKEVSQQPQQVQQMTHIGAPPMRDIKVDMPLFGGEYSAGQAPYDIANPMSGVAQTAYDMKTVPLYFTPWTAPIGAGMDVAEGVATGDPLTASLAMAFGPGGKMAKAAGIGAANYFIDPSEAEAGPARWFSKAMEVASALPMEKMTGQQALAMLRKGTSPEELRWTGAENFLSSRPQVSKSELVEYLNNNRIQVNEVTLGGDKPWDEMDVVVDPDIMAEFQPKIDEYAEEVRQLRDQQKAMDSPDQSVTYGDRWKFADAVAYAKQKLWFVKEAARKKQIERMGGLSKKPKYQSYSTPGGEGYRENLYTLGLGKKTYKSSHWDDPDVLFHTRSQTLSYDPPGSNRPYRVHNVDETQSDWGQDVRKHGMKDPTNNWRARYDEAVKKNTDDWVEQKATAAFEAAPNAYDSDIEKARAWARRYAQTFGASKISQQLGRHQEYLDLYNAMNREGEAMPAGPFVGGTEGWTDRSIKQELDKALDSDADYFSWTPGQVHADRYDLSRHIGSVMYDPYYEHFTAFDPNGRRVVSEEISDTQKLDNYVGKELGDKIRSMNEERKSNFYDGITIEKNADGSYAVLRHGKPTMMSGGYGDWFYTKSEAAEFVDKSFGESLKENPIQLSGLDLKTGGEGMKGYYDKVYLKRIQDVIKKATGEKPVIEEIEVQTGNGPRKQFGIKLTDEMREKARFSDFNRGGTVTAPNSYGNDDPAVSRAIALTREY